MLSNDNHTLMLVAAFGLGVTGVLAAFVVRLGGLDGAVTILQRILSRLAG